MKLVAIARAPALLENAARVVATATGLTMAEARMRLAPEPPALVARLEPAPADALAGAMRAAGIAALAIDMPAPSDADRTPVHTFAIEASGVTLAPRFGAPLVLAWPDVLAILRGVRASRLDTETVEKVRRPSVGLAVATQGLAVTRMVKTTVRSSEETTEQVILVYARDGRAATLAERQLDFTCLGPRMQPSSTANMVELASALRQRAPGAFYDERLLRLGRRPLPFLQETEVNARTPTTRVARTDTGRSLDVLAEVLRQALDRGLLP